MDLGFCSWEERDEAREAKLRLFPRRPWRRITGGCVGAEDGGRNSL